MKITFIGTRGYIDNVSRRHKWHAATLIEYKGQRLMIDCGLDWSNKVFKINPDAIIITHAHPDHAWGLKNGSPCPVYTTKESWQIMAHYPILKKIVIHNRKPIIICGMRIESFEEVHSIRAPAVGYRITAGKKVIFCSGDVVYIQERHEALKGVQLYIGDGATMTRPLIRKRDGVLIGHTPISTQLTWCQKEGIPWAIFTHCGTPLVVADGRTVAAKVRQLGNVRGVNAHVAYDGKVIVL